ncbi:MAG TPA: R3H domain-containing nucleic acid-binding protein [Thermomicrobiales bacterium]|jgi:stage III sporulation protein SpoIIIAA|nr:R3H domain-containing nucleic acid-binding protein [Thermomicrobiales bacterium]
MPQTYYPSSSQPVSMVPDGAQTDRAKDETDAPLTPPIDAAEVAVTDNLDDLLDALPPDIADPVRNLDPDHELGGLVELVLDLGRRPEARFQHGELLLTDRDVTREDLALVAGHIGQFGEDNRAGIERTLHRISAIRNRKGDIVGLTCRIGRAVFGTIQIISDLIESGESVLLLGRPGVGKTTMLRETARVLADEYRKRVVIVDTSNEIAGDGDIPHPAIGRARRMQVPTPNQQHGVMIEAVENHMPEVIVIDEIGTELEAGAARTIAERGVQLIGTAHGNSLENLMLNPTLSDLIGGIQSVTLSDEEARRRGTQKSILERKGPPTFGIMVELISRDEVAVHRDVASTVDGILRGVAPRAEERRRNEQGELEITKGGETRRDPSRPQERPSTGNQFGNNRRGAAPANSGIVDLTSRQPRGGRSAGEVRPAATAAPAPITLPTSRGPASGTAAEPVFDEAETGDGPEGFDPTPVTAPNFPRGRGTEAKPLRLYPFGISRNRLESAINQLGVPATIVRDLRESDMVVTLKNYYRRKPQSLREAENRGTPVYVMRSNTETQMENVLAGLFPFASSRRTPVPAGRISSVTDHVDAPDGSEWEGDDDLPAMLAADAGPAPKASDDVVTQAMVEAEDAIAHIMGGSPPISLAPQGAYIRRLQHQLADRYNLGSRSRGREPYRHVELYRLGTQ